MISPENPGPISEELFDQFRSSVWPTMFSAMAQQADSEGVAVRDLNAFNAYESGLTIAPREEQQMLSSIGIMTVWDKEIGTGRRTVFGRYIPPRYTRFAPHITEFGLEVIAACENLVTPEEHEAANEAARPALERAIAETKAQFGL
jgi:hypothetical protein